MGVPARLAAAAEASCESTAAAEAAGTVSRPATAPTSSEARNVDRVVRIEKPPSWTAEASGRAWTRARSPDVGCPATPARSDEKAERSNRRWSDEEAELPPFGGAVRPDDRERLAGADLAGGHVERDLRSVTRHHLAAGESARDHRAGERH